MTFLADVYLGNSILDWLISGGAATVTFFFLIVLKKVLARRLQQARQIYSNGYRRPDRGSREEDESLCPAACRHVFAGSLLLALPERASALIARVTTLGLLLQAGIWGSTLLVYFITKNVSQRMTDDPASATTMTAMGFLGKLAIWTVILLLGLENLGFDITALIAGLGVGGIAIALALQNILGDLFASLSIVLDKPFVIGDFIIVDNMMGTVEHVGLKTTRVKSLSGEQLVFSNADLLKSRIRNYKRMVERRVVFSLGVTYQTSHENVEGHWGNHSRDYHRRSQTRVLTVHIFRGTETSHSLLRSSTMS